jgi:glycosyltransferase involved in cell wall biosynthesis
VRILHSIYDGLANPWCGGGGALRTWEICRRLADRHEVTLLSGRYPGAPEEEEREGVRILRVGCSRSYATSRFGFSVAASRLLARASFDLWVYGFSAFSPILAPERLRRRALLEFFHSMAGHATRKRPLAGVAAVFAENMTLRAYRDVIGISPSVLSRVAEKRGTKGLHLVYTGVDAACFDVPISEQDYILFFGRLDTYNKGIDLLLKAFAQARTADSGTRLIVAGRGTPERQRELAAMGKALGISDRLEIIGAVSDEQKGELFGGALFTCMPSRFEGWGIAAIEAGAAGKAVVGTDIPGLADAIRPDETGLLVPNESVDDLAVAMQRLIDEPETRKRLGAAGRAWARQFTWDRIARDQEKVYEEVVGRRG